MKIALASDHAGFELKEAIKKYIVSHEIVDFGTFSEESMDYPDTGFQAAESVASGECDRGILICGSGIGMSIVANKVKGVRAALCLTTEFAKLARNHNDANILVLPGRFISHHLAGEIIRVWLSADFEGGRHRRRLEKIKEYEIKNKK